MEGTPIGYRTPPLNRDLVVGRAILDARIINVTDLANSDDFPLGRELARRYGHSLRGVTLSAVVAFFEKLPPCLVGMEACASSHHWSRELQKLGHPVRLMLREAPTSDAT
jgi:hypothetical protein